MLDDLNISMYTVEQLEDQFLPVECNVFAYLRTGSPAYKAQTIGSAERRVYLVR